MFDSLTEPLSGNDVGASMSSIKDDEERVLLLPVLAAGVQRWKWLRSVLKVFSAFQNSAFTVSEAYDYTKST